MFLCFCKNPAMALCADACNLSWENWGAQPAETAAFIQTQRGEPGSRVATDEWIYCGMCRRSEEEETKEISSDKINQNHTYWQLLCSSLPWHCCPSVSHCFSGVDAEEREAQIARLLQPPEAEWCCFIFKTSCETRSKFTNARRPRICKYGSD